MQVGCLFVVLFFSISTEKRELYVLPAIPAFAENYYFMVHMAGGFWFLAFLVFVFRYASMLIKPRVDGRPG